MTSNDKFQTKVNPPVIICVSSGKGGVGKTSFTVNMAAALAHNTKKILLIDGDLGLANADIMLGINVRHTLREIIEEDRDPADILIEVSPGFHVLPASSGVPEMAALSYEEQAFLTSTLDGIISRFDYVLVDTAAGIGDSVLWFNNWADENIIILSPDPTAMTDAYALIKILNTRYARTKFYLVLNNVKNQKEGREVFDNMSAVLDRFLQIRPVLLGEIPQDSNVARAVRQQKPFYLSAPDSKAGRALTAMAARILDQKP
ncbi:MAG: MinD/ParA family protein [Proteobacteria bacterium]|nr:MinD/ParA family protein [Pseudomonadota bacterium]MBU1716421.1 MinD/ParA family protein [Pseudomonadota bacterium]